MAFFLPFLVPLFEGGVADIATTAATSVARSVVTNGIESVAKGAARNVVTNAVKGAAKEEIKKEVKSIPKKAASAAQNYAADKAFRENWTPSQLDIVGPQHPGKNIMIVCTKHNASNLQGVEHSVLVCQCPASKSTVNYDCYVFDSGEFELQGDGGFENWAFNGKFVRNGKKVTFSKA